MLTRCLPRPLLGVSSSIPLPIRPLTTSLSLRDAPRAPALGDISGAAAESFNAKQKEFRENLAAAKAAKDQADSQSLATPEFPPSDPPAPPPRANGEPSPKSFVVDAAVPLGPLGLGSLSTHRSVGEERQARMDADTATRKSTGTLSNLIYGTPEGRAHDQDIERSFSQLLARGKYVHSIVFHQVKPKKVDEYVELVGNWYPKMAAIPENKVNLVGSWRSEVGDCDMFVHIWEYQRYTGYHASLHNIHHHPDFPAFDKRLKSLITSKRTSLMQEFSFWPTTPPRRLGGLFELRSYTLHPGNLLEWETHWRKGLKARREVMEGVGAWFCQIGDLNTVHHLWQFADLEERKIRREQSWGIEGWGETVHKTVPLIQTMKSHILVPMEWSPVG